MRLLLFVILTLALGGCNTFKGEYPKNSSLVPDGAVRIFPRYKITHADALQIMGVAALVYFVVDPEAPNWEITETRLADKRVLFDLRMKNFAMGGTGEARQVLLRRAEALMREEGAREYRIQSYEESIDSRILFPHRTARAEIQLVPASRSNISQDKLEN